MKITKAINELQNQCCVPNSEFQKPEYQARALGIEALKKLKSNREHGPMAGSGLLPGEEPE